MNSLGSKLGVTRSGMNVLIIGSDYTLAMDRERVIGDSQDRHILYGKYVSNLFIVVTSPKRMGLGVKKLSENVVVYPTSSRRFLSSWDAYRIGKNICRHNKIDIITTQDPFLAGLVGYWLKRRFHIPLNVQLHADFLDNEYWIQERVINYFFNKLGKRLIKKADTIRVVGSVLERKVISYGIPQDRTWLIPVQVDMTKCNQFSPVEMQHIRKQYLLGDGKLVLCVAALRKQKNIPNLLESTAIVVRKHPSTRLLICGDGEARVSLEALSRKLGLTNHVTFLGNIPHDYLPNYYYACDFLVLASDYEGLGRVLIEAAVAKKALIATDICGPGDIIIDNRNGFLVPPRDSEALAEKMMLLIEDSELVRRMGEEAHRHVTENFNPDKIVEKLSSMWHQTAKPGK